MEKFEKFEGMFVNSEFFRAFAVEGDKGDEFNVLAKAQMSYDLYRLANAQERIAKVLVKVESGAELHVNVDRFGYR